MPPHTNNFMVTSRKVGQFLIILGGFLLVLFVTSDIANDPAFNMFFFGLAGLVIGVILYNQDRPEKSESERFRWIRGMLNRRTRDKYKEK